MAIPAFRKSKEELTKVSGNVLEITRIIQNVFCYVLFLEVK